MTHSDQLNEVAGKRVRGTTAVGALQNIQNNLTTALAIANRPTSVELLREELVRINRLVSSSIEGVMEEAVDTADIVIPVVNSLREKGEL